MVLHLSFVSDEVKDADEEMLVFPVHFRILFTIKCPKDGHGL